MKEIVDKTKAFNRYFIKLKIEKTFSPFYKFLDWISSIEIQLNVNKFFKYFIAIIHTLKLFVKIFFNMFKKPIIWIKAHPMNFYLLMEILMLLAITASVVFLIIKYDILREPVSFLNLIIILSMVSGVIGYIIFIFEKDSRTFYADWQFYSRYSLFGVLIKSIARALFCAAVASIGFVTILSGILVFSFYAITLLILSFLLIGIIGLITYILKLANNHKELSSFVVTMMITVISYFIYRNRFMEEILIWLAAFGTGSISSFTV